MAITSQKLAFDSRLIVIEELLAQRRTETARRDLESLSETDFAHDKPQVALFCLLSADIAFTGADYRRALDLSLRSASIFADTPCHQRYARALYMAAKTYAALGDLRNAEIKARDALASYRRSGDMAGQIDALNELARVAFVRSQFKAASQFLDEAITMAADNPSKTALLRGNVGRTRLLLGEWSDAEQDLRAAISWQDAHDERFFAALNLLSLGYLHLRKREHVLAGASFEKARAVIDESGKKREKLIYLEYAGELAFDKGDLYRAKSLLAKAYQEGRQLAPDSALVTQTGRRLAEVELALDNLDAAMKYAQKALELATRIGEKAEVALSKRTIAQVFGARSNFDEALEYGREAVELAREAGDPYDLARTLLVLADLNVQSGAEEVERVRALFDEAARVFKKLHLDYWLAEAEFRSGVYGCQQGDLARGFRRLSRAEKTFSALAETVKVRQVSQFLTSLADQAVALSQSEDNKFKVFGKLINERELDGLRSGRMIELLEVLVDRTGADRAVILVPEAEHELTSSSFEMTREQTRVFVENFRRLIGEEISAVKPTLVLDCRRDPYLNDLLPDFPEVIASLIVVPFRFGEGVAGYIYLDKLTADGTLNPFSQEALNFTVGFSDIVAFKAGELQRSRLMEDNRRLRAQLMQEAAFPNIITRNHELMAILDQVRQVVDSNISITIAGPTGTGKDLLARAIHYNSVRRDKRFLSVNCAALPETLLESELFGYRRGAFTGADRDKPGLFEDADGGTFFLDEIADMPLSVQAKILRVLEEKELVRLGESVPRKVDVRIISATNKDLKEEMARGSFRQDLYYRLAALTFHLPPLSDRREDIPLLVEHFLEGSSKKVSADAMSCLVSYAWPGNVRELDNEIKKLVLLAGANPVIDTDVLSEKVRANGSGGNGSAASAGATSDETVFNGECSLYDYLAGHEKRFILKALKERHGVKKHAAALLNIPESTLRLKIKEYNIDLNRLDAIH